MVSLRGSIVLVVAAFVISGLLSGCAFMNGSHQRVRISTNVPARVYSGNQLVAETGADAAATARLRRGKEHFLVAKARGYEDASASLNREYSSLGTLDLVGAMIFVVPVITFATGHAYSIDPSRIHLDLERAGD